MSAQSGTNSNELAIFHGKIGYRTTFFKNRPRQIFLPTSSSLELDCTWPWIEPNTVLSSNPGSQVLVAHATLVGQKLCDGRLIKKNNSILKKRASDIYFSVKNRHSYTNYTLAGTVSLPCGQCINRVWMRLRIRIRKHSYLISRL